MSLSCSVSGQVLCVSAGQSDAEVSCFTSLSVSSRHTHAVRVRRVQHTNNYAVYVVRSDGSDTLSSQLEMSTFTVVLLLHVYLTAGVASYFVISFYMQST